MVNATERNWMDSWPVTIQTNVESEPNTGDTH